MTDRELLEAAARAAGIELVWDASPMDTPRLKDGSRQIYWNPLREDGDALRLAVKLRLQVHIEDYGSAARLCDSDAWTGCESKLYGGIEVATRRAIVRAAAAPPRGEQP